jgi:hypothetical protein
MLLFKKDDIAAQLNVTPRALDALISGGFLETVRVGRSDQITDKSIGEFLDFCAATLRDSVRRGETPRITS